MREEMYRIDESILIPRSILEDDRKYESSESGEEVVNPEKDSQDLIDREDSSASNSGPDFEEFSRMEFSELLRRPLKGSLLARALNILKNKNSISERQIKAVIERVIYDELLPFLLGTEYSGLVYIVARLVAPHDIAVRVCQEFANELKTSEDEYRFLSSWTKMEIQKRGDLQKIVKQIAVLHPPIMQIARNAVSRLNR